MSGCCRSSDTLHAQSPARSPFGSPASLNAALLASDSATAVLQALCGGVVLAQRSAPDCLVPCLDEAAPLQASGQERIVRRQVRLVHGVRILSEAELWYSPERLAPGMARRLAGTEQPFGVVTRPLAARRRTFAVRFGGADEACALEHKAVLLLPGGQPLAVVHERYAWSLFSPA